MSRQNSCDLVSVDQTKDIALTIVNQQGSRVKIEAVGRYYLNPDNSCEVAFITRENQQGKGMASRLMKQMIAIAKQRGVSKMVAYVRSENKPMITVFEQFEFKRVFNPDPAEVELVLFLQES